MRGLYGNLLIPSLRALLFMQDFSAGSGASRLKSKTGQPTRETLDIAGPRGTLAIDVYRPAEGARGGLLLIPGVAKDGKDDVRMVAFATTLARNGFAVVSPDLQSLRSLVVQPDHYRDVVAAFEYMAAQPDLACGGRIGIGGFSFAIGPGLRAALEPVIANKVRFLFCIGGYHDIMAQLRFVTTGAFRASAQEPWQHMEADHYGAWVTAAALLGRVQDEDSRLALRAVVDRRVPDRQADVSDLLPRLVEPGSRALFDLVTNTVPDLVVPLFEKIPADMRGDFLSMNLANLDLTQLKAKLILVHGYEDSLIPYTESLALYRRAPAGRKRLYLVHGLSHVNLAKPGLMDAWGLVSSVTALLREQS
jgi:hypothetical protein